MSTRPEVVGIIRSRAFSALASQCVPEDTTPQEEAEGLVSYALHVLSRDLGSQTALNEVQGIVDKYTNATLG